MNDIKARQDEIVSELAAISDWRDRYRRIIQIGRDRPDMPEADRDDGHLVKGCQSRVWLHADLDGDRVRFRGFSDTTIVNGLVSLLMIVFDDATPADILAADASFLDRIGLHENLSQNRANGLAAMIKQIKAYAIGYQHILSLQGR
jgi:cysteine desulfuration protein SufE